MRSIFMLNTEIYSELHTCMKILSSTLVSSAVAWTTSDIFNFGLEASFLVSVLAYGVCYFGLIKADL
jgi:hypothetical protein